MTLANYWRASKWCTGECPPHFRQLANVHE
ncbi:unnamed protein product, partial [Rotaria magnacalcarata]